MNLPAILAAAFLLAARSSPGAELVNALLVGGGPDLDSNAAQIESHVRFVASLVPPPAVRRLLFADGNPEATSVSVADATPLGRAQSALSLLLPNSGLNAATIARPPELGARLDGAASREAVHRAFAELVARNRANPGAPVLLYFAGHGARDDASGKVTYNLWNNTNLAPGDLAAELAGISSKTAIVLVMAQCYSGGFANTLFQRADPTAEPIPQNLAGFFSAKADRTASGCGVTTNAADYQDFSSYFFGALSGRDRFGKPVTGVDSDTDGRVSLHEAFCWAVARDASFDTPVCTSDVFLERLAALPDEKIFTAPYADIRRAASPAQRIALDLLSEKLGAAGEHRALEAYDRLALQDPLGRPAQLVADRQTADDLSRQRGTALGPLLKQWPALRWPHSEAFDDAADAAAEALAANQQLTDSILAAGAAHDAAAAALDNEEAWLTRFTDLYRGIARAKHLREHGEADVKRRFERLWEAENASLPVTVVK